ncbi:MAG: acyl-CoA dehydrogenase family protein [Armatimonadetes bacterium]|nr:acyl-CoA dehydrogenase family protein [Armatimonadota bacterium]
MSLTLRGGEFIIKDCDPSQTFTPEDLTSEDHLIAQAAEDFIRGEVMTQYDAIESQADGVMIGLLKKAGQLGLMAGGLPEAFGGAGLSKATTTLVSERISIQPSFAVSLGAHIGIGTLPILFFGTPEQKRKYIPKLGSGEQIAAFSLSEAECGSDPLSAKTKATLSPDGTKYLLNGAKMWTTNGGFADVFIVFAKIDGEQFTAFIVERNFPGVSVGREEHKLGIKGSSTRRVILENAEVPIENVLGEIGKGHRIAFGVLNIGRFKLAASALGVSKEALRIAVRYAKERKQFGREIASFGMIQQKIADMATKVYVLESAIYRTAGLLDSVFHDIDASAPDANDNYRRADEEYPVECAIMKVFGSEVLDFVVDENLQIHGGFGFTEEFPAARMYRDARINRIFEGTNEINRLLSLGMLMKRALKGHLPGLMEAAQAIRSELNTPQMPAPDPTEPIEIVAKQVGGMKKAALMTAGMAVETLGATIENEQEIVAALADCLIEIYALESALLRTRKLSQKGLNVDLPAAMTMLYGYSALDNVERSARWAINAFAEGDTRQTLLIALRRYCKRIECNPIGLQRQAAAYVIEREREWSASSAK